MLAFYMVYVKELNTSCSNLKLQNLRLLTVDVTCPGKLFLGMYSQQRFGYWDVPMFSTVNRHHEGILGGWGRGLHSRKNQYWFSPLHFMGLKAFTIYPIVRIEHGKLGTLCFLRRDGLANHYFKQLVGNTVWSLLV